MLFNCTATAELKESPERGKSVASVSPTIPLIPSRKFLLTMFRLALRVLHPSIFDPLIPPSRIPFHRTLHTLTSSQSKNPVMPPSHSTVATAMVNNHCPLSFWTSNSQVFCFSLLLLCPPFFPLSSCWSERLIQRWLISLCAFRTLKRCMPSQTDALLKHCQCWAVLLFLWVSFFFSFIFVVLYNCIILSQPLRLTLFCTSDFFTMWNSWLNKEFFLLIV